MRVGPSPDWLRRRLATLGVAAINNVVDITNYVLFECGQPLHAFDFAKLRGGRIVVREPRAGEKLEAIDHKTYDLAPGMCVNCDTPIPKRGPKRKPGVCACSVPAQMNMKSKIRVFTKLLSFPENYCAEKRSGEVFD